VSQPISALKQIQVEAPVDRRGLASVQLRQRKRRRQKWPYLFILPLVVVLGLVFVYPLVSVVRDSFYSGTVGNLQFAGLTDWRYVLTDPVFRQSLLNNVKLLSTVPIMTVGALAVALILNEGIRLWRIYRFILFVPYILPAVGMGLCFAYLLQKDGSLNTILADLHLNFLALDWIGSQRLSIFSIGGVVIWQQLGFGIILFTAALLSLSPDLMEASVVDGANWWQRQRFVIIPHLRGIIELFVVLEAITVLSWVFTYVYVLTQGGPGTSSSVMEYYIWQNGFESGAVGVGATAAVALLAISSILIFIYVTIRVRRGDL
jgi:ABC-type sugar transport system permease subunit